MGCFWYFSDISLMGRVHGNVHIQYLGRGPVRVISSTKLSLSCAVWKELSRWIQSKPNFDRNCDVNNRAMGTLNKAGKSSFSYLQGYSMPGILQNCDRDNNPRKRICIRAHRVFSSNTACLNAGYVIASTSIDTNGITQINESRNLHLQASFRDNMFG